MKPIFFKDEELAEHAPITRILFEGLWCLADKEGRLEDRPKYIKAEILPYDKCNVEKMLQDLHDTGFIVRYGVESEVQGNQSKRYIQIATFKKHQRITGKEAEYESEIPPPPEGVFIEQAGKQWGNNGETPGGPGREGNRKGKDIYSQDFENLWKTYPKKVGKTEAESAFKKTVKSPEDLIAITHALENYLRSRRVIDGYAQDAHRWFKKWREWETFTEAVPEKVSPYRDTDDLKARWKAEGKSSCHGKEIVKQEDGSMRCDYCLATA